MKTKLRHIIFSIIFAFLFGIILFIELFDFINLINTNDVFNLILTFLAIIVSGAGMYVSIIWGVVRLFKKENEISGGKKNGKEKK